MQLHVLSDLHLEFAPVSVPRPKADVVVLAGDIATGEDGIHWIRRTFPEVPVLYVLGNHEFYGQALPTLTENLKKECAGTNIHLLENDVFEFGDVVFLGATLWTDFELDANHVLAETLAAVDMADFKQIRFSRTYRKFLPSDSRQLHQESLRWLSDALDKYRGKKIVVVTHHAPRDRKSTRLNSSHVEISYAVFCLKKKTKTRTHGPRLRRSPPASPLRHSVSRPGSFTCSRRGAAAMEK